MVSYTNERVVQPKHDKFPVYKAKTRIAGRRGTEEGIAPMMNAFVETYDVVPAGEPAAGDRDGTRRTVKC